MANAEIDDNFNPSLIAVSETDGETIVRLEADPDTGRLLVKSLPDTTSLTERYDYDSTTTIYTATAPVGTAEASTGWTINKYDLTDPDNSSGKIATDVSWTNRASGTYN